MLLQVTKRSKGIKAEFPKKAERPRWFVPLADRLLGRLSMIPVVVLPLMTAAFLVLAFVSGELSDIEFGWLWALQPGSDLLSALQWVFTLIYVGLAALIVAAVGFLLRTESPTSSEDDCGNDGSLLDFPKERTEWPWLRHGGARRWAARGCVIGAWILAGTAVVSVPVMMNLIFEVVEAGNMAAVETGVE